MPQILQDKYYIVENVIIGLANKLIGFDSSSACTTKSWKCILSLYAKLQTREHMHNVEN